MWFGRALVPGDRWPRCSLLEYAHDLASLLQDGPFTPGSLAEVATRRLPWVRVTFQRLEACQGRQDALTVPTLSGGFHIVLDPERSPRDAESVRPGIHATDWRVAHELGHTYFYLPASPPARWREWRPSEEVDADLFADSLVAQLVGCDPGADTATYALERAS